LSAALVTGLMAEWAPFQVMAWIAGPFALLLAYTIAVWSGKTPLAALLRRIHLRHEALLRLARAAASAEGQISQFCQQKPLAVVGASLFSLMTGCAMLLEYWVTLKFLGIQVNLFQAIAVLTAALMAFLFPLPGGLGALEASQVLAMTALGFNPALGLSASLLIRARDISLGGLGLLWAGVLARQAAPAVAPTQIVE